MFTSITSRSFPARDLRFSTSPFSPRLVRRGERFSSNSQENFALRGMPGRVKLFPRYVCSTGIAFDRMTGHQGRGILDCVILACHDPGLQSDSCNSLSNNSYTFSLNGELEEEIFVICLDSPRPSIYPLYFDF